MSKLLDFYLNDQPTDAGHYLLDIISLWNNDEWEKCHDFIQWVFPLPEPSAFNPDAPILDDEFIEKYKSSTQMKMLVAHAIDRALIFFGHPQTERPFWFKPGDHNMLRITRAMKFLRSIGEFQMALMIFNWLGTLDILYPDNIPDITWEFWEDAVFGKSFNEAVREG